MKRYLWKYIFGLITTLIILHYLSLINNDQLPLKSSPLNEVAIRDFPLASFEQSSLKCEENATVQSFPDFNEQPKNMKDFLTYRHCRSFELLNNSPMKCGGPTASHKVLILLAIKTAPGNFERREIIRKTWGEEKIYGDAKVRRIFLSGVSRTQEEEQRMMQLLATESQTYGDILQWNFQDTFYNLTLKQVLFLQWQQQMCPGVQYIFNGDDDVFVNIFNVITYLQSLQKDGRKSHLFVGALNIGMPPIREKYSKYYVPEALFPGDYFVPYCGGGGILISGFTFNAIFKESDNVPLLPIDDAYLGMCLKKAGLKPNNHEGIRTFGIKIPAAGVDSFDPCYYRELLMVHRFVPYEILVMWKALQITKLKCHKYKQVMEVSRNQPKTLPYKYSNHVLKPTKRNLRGHSIIIETQE